MKLHNVDLPSFPEFTRPHDRDNILSWATTLSDRELEASLDRKTQAMRKKIDLANAEFCKRKVAESKLLTGE